MFSIVIWRVNKIVIVLLGVLSVCANVYARNVERIRLALPEIILAQTSSPSIKLPPERTRLTVVYTSLTPDYAPLWLAADKGYFKEWGLIAELIYTRSITGIQAILGGNAQLIYSGCTQIMEARRAGADIVLIASHLSLNPYAIVSRSDIMTARQLAGKRVAINRLGDTSHVSARLALKEAGIDPDAVTFVQIGSSAERFVALQSGSVEAAIQAGVYPLIAKELGFNVLIDLSARKLPYCGGGIGVTKHFMTTYPRTVEAFMRGYLRGNAQFREGNPEVGKSIIAKYNKIAIHDSRLDKMYKFYAKLKPKYPVIQREAVTATLNIMAQEDKAWRRWDAERFYDTTITDKLRKEGFLDTVYTRLE